MNYVPATGDRALTFSPLTGPVGTLITVLGADFTTLQSASLNAVPAVVVGRSTTSAEIMVMTGTTYDRIALVNAGAVETTSDFFTVIPSGVLSSQQGSKLAGTGGVGPGSQGTGVSISGDGNTVIVGGPTDNGNAGAAWIYTRSGGVLSQQGNRLVGTGAAGAAHQGQSVSISADGNTAIVGGNRDAGNVGAAWIFSRNAGVWAQEGAKLVGTGASGTAFQGDSVAMSADGNTAIVGGHFDNTNDGAAWIFTRSAGTWAQQGLKLVGTGAVGSATQGFSVAMSADGNTAVVGGPADNGNVGAAWVYTRSAGVWTQQGAKLVGTGAIGAGQIGSSVAVSADGNTAVLGGRADNASIGAAWVFTRSAGVWTQQGSKLVGTGGIGASEQGRSVSVSADGNTAIVGGPIDNSSIGAIWVYARAAGTWTQQGTKLIGTGPVGNAQQGSSISVSADGNTAIVGGALDNTSVGAAWIFTP